MLLAWAIIATAVAFVAIVYRNFFDKGHRLFGVPNEKARRVVISMLQECKAGKSWVTFDLGPTYQRLSRQTVLSDGITVVHSLDEDCRKLFPSTGLSYPAKDPIGEAEKVCRYLQESGFDSSIWVPLEHFAPKNSMVIVNSTAFDGWMISFRLSQPKMIPFLGKFIHLRDG